MDKKNLKQLFNMDNWLHRIMTFAAYVIALISAILLIYLAFVKSFTTTTDWRTMTVFSVAAIFLAWLNWSSFYRKNYEKLLAKDIDEADKNHYSIHSRYYYAVKDWTDKELQAKIDEFNKEYIAKWLRDVEATTGVPIESCWQVQIDERTGKPIIDEATGKEKLVYVKGIKDRPYKGFHHKWLMWRIKHHRYPKSGYKTSMELMSLFSYQESNLNKRHLKADKYFHTRQSLTKLFTLILTVSIGGSLVPEFIDGDWLGAVLRLLLTLASLVTSIFWGSMNGAQGAKMKLDLVEQVSEDLEKWADKKPLLVPYEICEDKPAEELPNNELEKIDVYKPVDNSIFFKPNSHNK